MGVKGPVARGAVQKAIWSPRSPSLLLSAYQRSPRWKTLNVCDTPSTAATSWAESPASRCHALPSQKRHAEASSTWSGRTRATWRENPKTPSSSGLAVPNRYSQLSSTAIAAPHSGRLRLGRRVRRP